MTTRSQVKRTTVRLEDLLIFGIGVTAGALVALLLLGLALDNWIRADSNLASSLRPLLEWISLWLRERLIGEASLMGWPLTAETSGYWYISRAAGLVGYLLLWAAIAWGLVVSTKVTKGLIPAPFSTSVHEFLSLGALAFSGVHALALLGDRYIEFGLVDIVYPFAASYRPAWVGLGQLGFYLSVGLTLSFYLRRRISPKTWRSLHYLTFLAYVLVVVHSLASGTDTSAPAIQVMYLGTTAAIVFLVYYRLLTTGQRRGNRRPNLGKP
jgi:predicted ferric reductase